MGGFTIGGKVMAQSSTSETLEELRDDVDTLNKAIAEIKVRLDNLEHPPVKDEDDLRAKFDALKARLDARFGHSLE
jgi:chaperonin cofactor prefoldin